MSEYEIDRVRHGCKGSGEGATWHWLRGEIRDGSGGVTWGITANDGTLLEYVAYCPKCGELLPATVAEMLEMRRAGLEAALGQRRR